MFVTLISDIQELLPFDCLNINELVPTEPQLGKEYIEFSRNLTEYEVGRCTTNIL